MRVQHLLEARQPDFYPDGDYPNSDDKSWMKRYRSRILLSYRPPKNLSGFDQNAVKVAYEKALAKFKELRDAHPTKLMFKMSSEADKYMKTMEYPGWPMITQFAFERPKYGTAENYWTIEFGNTRKGPLELEKQEYKAPASMDEVTFTDLGNGRIEAKFAEKSGPKFRIWLTAIQRMPKKFKGQNSSGKDMTDYFDIDRARPQRMTFKGTLEEIKAALSKGFGVGISYDKKDHAKKQDAPERKKEEAKFAAERAKERKAELYAKYGKEIVERVKIKPMSLEGDDGYQWALFLDGRRHRDGMTRNQAEGEQNIMWNWLLKWEKMSPKERLDHINAVKGMEAYFAYETMEKHLKADLPVYLDLIKKNAKAYVDSKQAAKDAIETSKVSDAQAKNIFNNLMDKLRDKND